MSRKLIVNSPNATIENEHCYAEYLHEKPIINKTTDGKYELKSEFTKYTIKTDLSVPKSKKTYLIFFKIFLKGKTIQRKLII